MNQGRVNTPVPGCPMHLQRKLPRWWAALVLVAVVTGCGGRSATLGTSTGGTNNAFTLTSGAAGTFSQPTSLVASPDGAVIYFVARRASDDEPAIYRLLTGTLQLSEVHVGAPLVEPGQIIVSPDGANLFVADAAADGQSTFVGNIFRVPSAGGTPQPLLAADLVDSPGGLGIDRAGTTLYASGYTGTNQPALFTLPTNGMSATVLVSGGLLRDPAALVADPAGSTLYVVDSIGSGNGTATIFRFPIGGSLTPLVTGVTVSFPAGIVTDLFGSTVTFTGVSTATAQAAVLSIPVTGGVITEVAVGSPLVSPTGLATSPTSPFVLFVADTDGNTGTGTIYSILR